MRIFIAAAMVAGLAGPAIADDHFYINTTIEPACIGGAGWYVIEGRCVQTAGPVTDGNAIITTGSHNVCWGEAACSPMATHDSPGSAELYKGGAYPVTGMAPPAIEAMGALPNAGTLYIRYCLIGSHFCDEYRANAYGQVCDQWMADEFGYNRSGDPIHPTPGLHYAGWRCVYFERSTDGKTEVSGAPGPEGTK